MSPVSRVPLKTVICPLFILIIKTKVNQKYAFNFKSERLHKHAFVRNLQTNAELLPMQFFRICAANWTANLKNLNICL